MVGMGSSVAVGTGANEAGADIHGTTVLAGIGALVALPGPPESAVPT